MFVLCTNINWDTTDPGETEMVNGVEQEVNHIVPRLPKTLVIHLDDGGGDQDDLDDELADALSDMTGFSVSGFCHRILHKPVYAIVKGTKYWDGKEWTEFRNFAKVYQRAGDARKACCKVGGKVRLAVHPSKLLVY